MGLVTVNFECVDQELPPNPVGSVVVRVYETNDTFVTELISDPVTGIASGLLDGAAAPTPHDYNIRVYKYGNTVDTPQAISIYDPPAGAPITGTNDFKITLDPNKAQAPADPALCRLSGYIRMGDGQPAAGQVIRFAPMFDPLIIDDVGVFATPVYREADDEGCIEVDLFRGGVYAAFVEDIHPNCIQEAYRKIYVPDRSTAELLNVLFPVVTLVEWNPVGPWSVAVGGTLTVTPTVTASDYRVLEGLAEGDVEYAVDDRSIAQVSMNSSTLTLEGISSGTTKLRVSRRDESISRVPASITGGVVDITVT